MKIILSILLLTLGLCLPAHSSKAVQVDSTRVEVRRFDRQKIEDYKNRQWFNYEEPAKPASGLGDWLLRKLLEFLSKFFSNQGSIPFFRYGIALAIIGTVTFVLFRSYVSGLFQIGKDMDKVYFEEVSDDIYANDLDKLLEKAISERAYRHGVRIMFLKFVKQLSDKQYIDWKLDKTNHEYWREIKQENILQQFKELTILYEYVWYGEFQVNESKFMNIRDNFLAAQRLL